MFGIDAQFVLDGLLDQVCEFFFAPRLTTRPLVDEDQWKPIADLRDIFASNDVVVMRLVGGRRIEYVLLCRHPNTLERFFIGVVSGKFDLYDWHGFLLSYA